MYGPNRLSTSREDRIHRNEKSIKAKQINLNIKIMVNNNI